MAKRGAAATAADVKATGFATLSESDQNWLDEYERKGWLIQFGDEGWGAVKSKNGIDGEPLDNPYELGPTDSFLKLMNMVIKGEKSIGSAAKAEENHKGDRYLDGMAPESIPALDDFIKRRDEACKEHRRLATEIKNLNAEGLDLFDMHKVQFRTDPETGKPIYNSPKGGYLRIKHTDKVETGGVEGDSEE